MSEIKYSFGGNTFNPDFNLGPFSVLLNPTISIGSNKNQRIGNRIKYKMLSVRVECSVNGGLAPTAYFPRHLRFTVLQPRLTNAGFTATDLFDDATNELSTIPGTNWRVMYDKFKVFTPNLSAAQLGTNTGRVVLNLHFRVRNNVNFRASADTLPTEEKDLYYLIITPNLPVLPAGGYNISGSWFSRMSYTDL